MMLKHNCPHFLMRHFRIILFSRRRKMRQCYKAGQGDGRLYFLLLIISIIGISKLLIFFHAYAMDSCKIFAPDSKSYINTARALQQTGHFAVHPETSDTPQIFRTPGYPSFIAGSFFIFGERYEPVILLQIFLSLGTLLIVYYISTNIWKTRSAGILAVLFYSLDIPTFMGSQWILSETLFTCMLSVAAFCMIVSLKKPRYLELLTLFQGICFAFATLTRPISYYLIIPQCVIFVLIIWKYLHVSFQRCLVLALLLVTPYGLLVGGWQIRNLRLTGHAEFSYIQGLNLFFYRGAGIVAQREGLSFQEAQEYLGYGDFMKTAPETIFASIVELDRRWKAESLRLFMQHPKFLLKDQLRGLVKMLGMPAEDMLLTYLGEYHESTGPVGDALTLSFNAFMRKWLLGKTKHFFIFLASLSILLLLYLSTGEALWHLIKTRDRLWSVHLWLWGIIFYFIVVSAGPEAYARFRIPILPFLSLYGGYGLLLLYKRTVRQK